MQSEILNKELLDFIPAGIVLINTNGEIYFTNCAATELLGIERQDPIKRRFDSPDWKMTDFHGNSISLEDYAFSQVMKTGKPVTQLQRSIVRPDGQKIYLIINAVPILENSKISHVLVTQKDVTDTITLKNELKGNEKRHQNIFDHLMDEVHIWKLLFDAEGKVDSWEVVDANLRALKNWRKTKKEVVGKNVIELFGEGARNEFLPLVQEIYLSQKPKRWETYFPPTDQILLMDSIPFDNYFISTGRDISESKKVQEELTLAKKKAEGNEIRYKTLLDSFETGVVVHGPDSSVIECNQRATKLLGLSRGQLMGKEAIDPYWRFIDEQGNAIPIEEYPVMKVIKNKEKVSNLTLGVIRGSEEKAWLSVNSTYLLNKDQEIEEIIISFIDITERINALNALVKEKQKAEASDKLKTAFLQNVSHEIRTPLNAINGFSQLLDKSEIDKDRKQGFIRIIKNSSEQLLSIVGNIVSASTLVTGQEKLFESTFDLNSVLEELLSVFRLKAENNGLSIQLTKPETPGSCWLKTDETKLRQILNNLLSNAIKFTQNGEVHFGYELREKVLKFFVKDNGIGIHKSDKERIFDRFIQADNNRDQVYGGTGLGLSISKGYVDLMGGKIWVESNVGKGATFYFELSNDIITDKPLEQEMISNEIHHMQPVKVLVGEDHLLNFLLLETFLEELPIQLIHAQDGEECLTLFKEHTDIELILMDINMPVLTGDEVARKIKQIKPEIPIIGQSGYALEEEKIKYSEIFDDYITKPIDSEILIQKINYYLNKSKMSD